MIKHAEVVVNKKFEKMRIKTFTKNKKIVDHKVDYQFKNNHVEKGVEDCLRYFDDTQFLMNEELRAQLREVKKQVTKNEDIIKNWERKARKSEAKKRSSVKTKSNVSKE